MRAPLLNCAVAATLAIALVGYAPPARSQGAVPQSAAALDYKPTKEFTDAFAAGNRSQLCDGSTVRLGALLGELAKNFTVNLFALPPAPIGSDTSIEARAVNWIIATAKTTPERAAKLGVSDKQFVALNSIRFELTEALVWLQSNPDGQLFRVARPLTRPRSAAEQTAMVDELFGPLTSVGPRPAAILVCAPAMQPENIAARPDQPRVPVPPPAKHNGVLLAVRGKIDDLAVMRLGPGGGEPTQAFGKASQASLAFTDNIQKGESNVAIEATLGIGKQVTSRDSAFLFGQYVQNTTETDVAGDDDDAKDIKAISFGLLARRSILVPGAFAGSLGLTVYPTFDLAQDARTGRARLFLSDIAIEAGSQPLCDFERDIGPLRLNCRLSAFAELARVYRVGRSTDLATLEDDAYLGLGGEVGVSLWLPALDGLAPLVLSSDYRYMAVVDGKLDDPHRWTVSLIYAVPKSNISVGLSRVEGANFETFQQERLNKLTIGFKY